MQRDTASEYTTIPLANRFRRGAQQLRAWFWEWTKTEAALYVLVGTILSLVAIHALWKPGYIAGGDFWPGGAIPKNQTLSQALALWGDSTTGFGSPQYNPTGVFWGILQKCLLIVGFAGPVVEFVTLAVPFVGAGLAVVWFVRTIFPSSKSAAIAAALGLSLSLYSTLNIETYDFEFSLAYVAWSGAWVWRRMQVPKASWIWAAEIALASLGFMVLVSPPPLALWIALWGLLWMLIGGWQFGTWRRVLPGALSGIGLSVVVNGWWLYAAHLTLFGSSGAVTKTFANPFAWGWVDQRAGLLNLLSMQGGWSWPQSLYFPWATIVEHGILHWTLYFPAFLAIAALVWYPFENYKRWIMCGILGVSLVVAQGLHAPFGPINAWLYLHMPFYWLLRDPQVEAGTTLYLSIFVLAGLGLEALLTRFLAAFSSWVEEMGHAMVHSPCHAKKRTSGPITRIYFFVSPKPGILLARANTVAMICGVLLLTLTGYPLWAATVIPLNHKTPNPVIHLPAYWHSAANYINSHSGGKKVLLLPNDDFYQMPYEWGFYGSDSVAQSLLRPSVITLSSNSGGYLGTSGANSAFQSELQRYLARPEGRNLATILGSLNIGWILERGDVVWNFPGRHILSPRQIENALEGQKGLRLAKSFGPLKIYQIIGSGQLFQAYGGIPLWLSSSPPNLFNMANLSHSNVPWVTDATQLKPRPSELGLSETPSFRPPKSVRLTKAGIATVIPKTVGVGVKWTNANQAMVYFKGPTIIDGRMRRTWNTRVRLRARIPQGRAWALQIGARTFDFIPGPLKVGEEVRVGSLAIPGGGVRSPLVIWESSGRSKFGKTTWSNLGDCNAIGRRTLKQAGISRTRIPFEGVSLRAVSNAACVSRSVVLNSANTSKAALVSIQTREQQGQPAEVQILWNNRSLQRRIGLSGGRWHISKVWIPFSGYGKLSTFVYAFGTGSKAGVVDDYRKPELWIMSPISGAIVDFRTNQWHTTPGILKVRYANPTSGNLVTDNNFRSGLWSLPFNANAILPITMKSAGLKVVPLLNGGVTLAAKYDGVGEAQVISGIEGGLVQISLQARWIKGYAPQVGLWGGNHWLWKSALMSGSPSWQNVNVSVHIPANVNSASLILYAYGNGTGTEEAYRNVSVKKWPSGTYHLTWMGGQVPKNLMISTSALGSDSYRLNVPRDARLLVMSASFERGWKVYARDHAAKWRHVVVDGWLNGWVIPNNAPRSVIIRFVPAILYKDLQRVAVVMIAGLLGVLVIAMTRWRRHNS